MSQDPIKILSNAADQKEPSSGLAPVPVTLFVIMAVLAYWGMTYLDRHGGGFNPKVYEPYASFKVVEAIQPVPEGGELLVLGKQVYARACSPCHQPSGLGAPGMFPPLAESEWVLDVPTEQIVRIVLNGLGGPITVKGQNYNNVMPPFKGTLTDEEIAAVVTFVRQNKAWGHKASGITPEEVTQIVKKFEGRATPWTVDDLKAAP